MSQLARMQPSRPVVFRRLRRLRRLFALAFHECICFSFAPALAVVFRLTIESNVIPF